MIGNRSITTITCNDLAYMPESAAIIASIMIITGIIGIIIVVFALSLLLLPLLVLLFLLVFFLLPPHYLFVYYLFVYLFACFI